ncbi:hypothetical protein CR513_44198, partial [Mucuna pruriens]
MEFTINLVLGVRSTSIVAYKMAPVELVDLKKKVEELLEKRMIRLSFFLGEHKLKDSDILKTTFKTHYKHYEYVVMIFHPFLDMFLIVFIDDIIVYSQNYEEHKKALEDHIGSLKGEMTVCQVFKVYYRRFIEGLSKTKICEQSFQELKKKLTTSPVLVLPNSGRPFEVYYGASHQGFNYPTHDLEFVAIVFALKIWRHYLYGARFDVFSNHMTLKYMFNHKELNIRKKRWMEFLKDYDFQLMYHPEKPT